MTAYFILTSCIFLAGWIKAKKESNEWYNLRKYDSFDRPWQIDFANEVCSMATSYEDCMDFHEAVLEKMEQIE